MKKIPALVFCAILAITLVVPVDAVRAAPTEPPAEPHGSTSDSITDEITQAFETYYEDQVSIEASGSWNYEVNEVFPSEDSASAVLWLAPVNSETDEPLETEPVLAVGYKSNDDKALTSGGWTFTIQNTDDWASALEDLPTELNTIDVLGDSVSADTTMSVESTSSSTTYGGYYLPWASGVTKRLTMGANHVSCSTRCTYAFDFADGTMFALLAAKGGSVYYAKDTCTNGSTSCTNSLVLKDESTSPTTYQIYLHLAKGTIPTSLKTVGTQVKQGQYIGNADDTGYSTGNHLHFMVVSSSSLFYYSGGGYYWGNSVDITFKDVSINYDSTTKGGRPCLSTDVGYGKCTEYQTKYTSGNKPSSNPPTGGLTAPTPNSTVNTSTVTVSGYGTDDIGVSKMSIMANYDGTWVEVGDSQTSSPFSYSLNLCDDDIPDGPVTLALRVWDIEGNPSTTLLGVRNILKDYACSTTTTTTDLCDITSSQAALYTETSFGGVCEVFDVGSYASGSALGDIGDNNVASLQVGQNVSATLYSNANYSGRAETFTSSSPTATLSDRNLSDNLIGNDTTSSLKVIARTATPIDPVINTVGSYTTKDSVVLSWNNKGGATKFVTTLVSTAYTTARDYSTEQSWSVGTLPAGTYTFSVIGRVAEYGGTTHISNTVSTTFTVTAATSSTKTFTAPYSDDMESSAPGWESSGLWRLGSSTSTAWIYNNGTNYASSSVLHGDLTSPKITLPSSTKSYLRFDSLYQTESKNSYFDQRRVQISVNGGEFTDLLSTPLNDDAMQYWLDSQVINLSSYAGSTVRIRFHFDAIDAVSNGYPGWMIDNFSIDTTAPPSCTETTSNNTVSTATSLTIGTSASGVICPAGDYDFYKFTGTSGNYLQVDVQATSTTMDSYLTLLDVDGKSVLTENDDIVPGSDTDSRISFLVPATGTYYLKVKAWGHPGVGGTDQTYTIKAIKTSDTAEPTISLTRPINNGLLSTSNKALTASVADNSGSIKSVEFWMHDSDWVDGVWTLVDTDSDGSNGWSVNYDTTGMSVGDTYAFYARAYDWAGNAGVDASWSVTISTFDPLYWIYMTWVTN